MRRSPSLLASLSSLSAVAVFAACGASTPPLATIPPVLPPAASVAPVASAPSLAPAQTGIDPTWMSPAADPCQDFFAYACGGFVRSTVIPGDRATWGTTEGIEKQNEELLRAVLEKAAVSVGKNDRE